MEFDEGEEKENLNLKRLYMPYKYSGKNFTFAEKEEQILQESRKWCKKLFRDTNIPESILTGLVSVENEKNLL